MSEDFTLFTDDTIDVGRFDNQTTYTVLIASFFMLGAIQPHVDCFSNSISQYDVIMKNSLQSECALLEEFKLLEEDWDGYGASPIDLSAIENCKELLGKLPGLSILSTEIMPTHLGGILLKYAPKESVMVKCDIGSKLMSYFVREEGKETQYYSFLEWNKQNVDVLIENIKSL